MVLRLANWLSQCPKPTESCRCIESGLSSFSMFRGGGPARPRPSLPQS